MFEATITNEEINTLPVKNFTGRIIVVDSPETMAQAETILHGQTLLGYDTESRPAFTKGLQYGISLVQISTADTALLFRVKLAPLSPAVIKMIENPAVIKIGAAIRDDLRGMQKLTRFTPRGFIDLQNIASKWGIDELSVKKLSAIVLGVKVSKAQRLSNWESVRLTPQQQDYAAMDAWVCREIYHTLQQHPTIVK